MRLSIPLALSMLLGACGQAAATPSVEVEPVEWVDDFLGSALRSQYTIHRATPITPQNRVGGWVSMQAAEHPSGEYKSGRFRLGDDPRDTQNVHPSSPFTHAAHAVGATRVEMDADEWMNATIGFVGPDDPNGVSGALLYRYQYGQKTWILQTCAGPEGASQCSNVSLNWSHQIGLPFTVELRLAPDRVEAWIDGRLAATSTENIPQGQAAWEYQIWAFKDDAGAQHDAAMLIDYLVISQDRL